MFSIDRGGRNSMRRRDFLKSSVALAMAAELGPGQARAIVPAHNWGKYDFGSGPTVMDRLNQGPFSQYPPDAVILTDDVVMTTTPSEEVVPNYGKGLITYLTADMGIEEIKSDNILQAIEDLVRFPTWREVQPRAGRLILKARFRVGEEKQQAHRNANSDERSRLLARTGVTGFRSRKSADG
jgi:hypothetical protein